MNVQELRERLDELPSRWPQSARSKATTSAAPAPERIAARPPRKGRERRLYVCR